MTSYSGENEQAMIGALISTIQRDVYDYEEPNLNLTISNCSLSDVVDLSSSSSN